VASDYELCCYSLEPCRHLARGFCKHLGVGHWLYAAQVNSLLKLLYSQLDTTIAKRTYPNARHMKEYIYGAAFMSVSRFRLALEFGLQNFFASFTLQLLHIQQRRDLPPDVSAHAAAYGKLDLLRWLQSVGCPFTALTTRGAAEGGHVHLLEFLVDAGCPLDDSATRSAVKGGRLSTLQVCIAVCTLRPSAVSSFSHSLFCVQTCHTTACILH
jgi:hypothetical protein